ncbi:SH3 domain-containing protein [Alcaligenes aquatilis]|uniref:SH3 domain-containing protein n=1 Tax=Alcaligenes aquatilis TaxID=323284 RepID=UPI000F6851C8|nr:SH3 domain-containing protein [Alcaligenes aquatilis]QXR34261.1 SH3 domain-containing protein [Alcaligenes aquatilis]
MINELAVVATSLSFFFGGGDEKASPVKTESAFTCVQINEAAGKRDYGAVNEMLGLSFRQLDKVYTEGSTIERFYRDRLRGDRQQYQKLLGRTNFLILHATGAVDRYTKLFTTTVIETCIENPRIGVLEASTKALNQTYQLTKTQPIYAICKAYNEKELSYQSLMEFVAGPEAGRNFDVARVREIQGSPSYGDAFLQNEISQLCTAGPLDPVLEIMISAAERAHLDKNRKEEALAREKREAEMAIREKEREEEERKEFEKYFSSLYESSEDITCSDYRMQYWKLETAQDLDQKQAYGVGLVNTIKDGIKLTPPYQQKKLEEELLSDGDKLLKTVYDFCENDNYRPLERVLAGVVPPERIKYEHPDRGAETSIAVRSLVAQSGYVSSVQAAKPVADIPEAEKLIEPVVEMSTVQGGSQVAAANSSAQRPSISRNDAYKANEPTAVETLADPFNRVAVINDPDGYTNVRIAADGKSKVVSRILHNERFHTYEQQGNWWAIRKADGLLGYVHKSRISLIP